jgi:glucose-1-phosphate cytidylyltransferase
MKVMLFGDGFGLRLREASETLLQLMVLGRPRPILGHVMTDCARFGHTSFIHCLGHEGEVIKNDFLTNAGAVQRLASG